MMLSENSCLRLSLRITRSVLNGSGETVKETSGMKRNIWLPRPKIAMDRVRQTDYKLEII